MRRNFYFRTQAEIVSGSANFAALILADAESFGLTPAQAAEYQAYDAALQSSYAAAVSPHTRTSPAVQRKNAAIRDVQREAQRLAKVIYGTGTADDSKLILLGLLPRASYTRRAAPKEPPEVWAVSVVGRRVRIRIQAWEESDAPTGRRPAGAIGAQVYSFVGEQAPADLRAYHHEGLATRGSYEVRFPKDVPGGATVWIAAAWVSTRGVPGDASAPARTTIQGGSVEAMAA
jgi:hypothetical protein